MCQNIISAVKHYIYDSADGPGPAGIMQTPFKRKLLWHLLSENTASDTSIPEILKRVNMKDVVYWVANSWKEGSNESLAEVWKKLLPASSEVSSGAVNANVPEDNSCSDLPELSAQVDSEDVHVMVQDWLEDETPDPGHQILTDQEIVAETMVHNDQPIGVEDSKSDDDMRTLQKPVTAAQAAVDAL